MLGYDILDAHGKQIRYVENDVLILMNKVGATNAKLVHKGRKPVISAIFGEFPKTQLPSKIGSSNVQVIKKDVVLKPVEERTEFELFDEVNVEVAVTKRAYIYHHDCGESGDGWNEPHVCYDNSECTKIFWGKLRAAIKELKPPRISRKHILERMKKGDIGFECHGDDVNFEGLDEDIAVYISDKNNKLDVFNYWLKRFNADREEFEAIGEKITENTVEVDFKYTQYLSEYGIDEFRQAAFTDDDYLSSTKYTSPEYPPIFAGNPTSRD